MEKYSTRHPANRPAVSRRDFMVKTGAAIAAFSIVPRGVLGGPGRTSPSDKPVVAGVGIGGVGHGQIQSCDKAASKIKIFDSSRWIS